MRLSKTSICAVAFLLISTIGGQAQVTTIYAGKLIDPESGTTSTNQTIIVEGGKIKAVGPGLPMPAGATVIDLSNFTVLPGLFDAHAHMCTTSPPEHRDLFIVDITRRIDERNLVIFRIISWIVFFLTCACSSIVSTQ